MSNGQDQQMVTKRDNVRDVMLLVQRLTPLNNIWFHLSLTNKIHRFTNSVLDARVTRMRMMTMCMRKGAKESGTKASW